MSGRVWTPYEMEIILHHHVSIAPFPRAAAPAYPEALVRLHGAGILDRADRMAYTTPVGAALVELWLATPAPRLAPIDIRTGKIIEIEDREAEAAKS